MLRFRLRYLLESKGIVLPYNYLIRMGFSHNIATRCLNGKIGQLKLSQVNLLCKTLNLTPNDLLEWHADKDEALPDNHVLRTLERNDKPFGIIKKINKLSYDQIKEVEKLISQLQTDGNSTDNKGSTDNK